MKENIIQNISSGPWPDIAFGPRDVSVCAAASLNLIPHYGEFDFRALLSTTLDYEKEVFEVLSARIDSYDAVVEVGANVGVYSAFFGRRLQELNSKAVVLCFEPSREAFSRLQRNLEVNGVGNVTAFNCAVGKEDGFVTFYTPRGHLTNGSLSQGFAALFSSEVVQSVVSCVSGEKVMGLLDGYDRLLLKIDAEGAERMVLESFEKLIRRDWPDIVLEVLDIYVDDLNSLSILSENYALFNIVPGGLQSPERFEAAQHRDYLLVPKSRSERDPLLRSPVLPAC